MVLNEIWLAVCDLAHVAKVSGVEDDSGFMIYSVGQWELICNGRDNPVVTADGFILKSEEALIRHAGRQVATVSSVITWVDDRIGEDQILTWLHDEAKKLADIEVSEDASQGKTL